MRSGFTYTGLFETKEDGTTIYYYGRRDGHALGYHVDEAAMRSIRRLYVELFAASAFGISPAFTAGYRWTAMLLAAVGAVSFYVRHNRLIKTLPVSLYPRPPFRKRVMLIGRSMSYALIVPNIFLLPAVAALAFSKLDGASRLSPALIWSVVIVAFAAWAVNFAFLFAKIKARVGWRGR